VRSDASPEQGSQIELVEQHGPDQQQQQQYHAEAKASTGSGDKYERGVSGHITVVTQVEVSSKKT
jgi:hypothetical protein